MLCLQAARTAAHIHRRNARRIINIDFRTAHRIAGIPKVRPVLVMHLAYAQTLAIDARFGAQHTVNQLLLAHFKAEYKYVERVLLVLCLASLSYVAAVFAIKPDWLEIGKAIITPSFQLNGPFLVTMLAVIGTTITPWGIYYLQASIADKGVDMKEYKYTRIDVGFGAAWGNIISAFILIVTAATLYVAGIAVTDAKEAAQALQPLAGNASTILFSIGLLGASLLAVSVLPLSTTYAFCEAYGFERGLNRKVKEAPVFYGLLIVIMVIGSLVVLIPGAPLFTMMILSQTVNAILLPIVLVLVLKIANNKQVMGKYTNSKLTNIFAILITVMIVLVTIALFFEPLLNKIV